MFWSSFFSLFFYVTLSCDPASGSRPTDLQQCAASLAVGLRRRRLRLGAFVRRTTQRSPLRRWGIEGLSGLLDTSDTQKSLGEFHGSGKYGKYGKYQPNERVEVWNVLKVPCIDSCLRHSETLIQHLASKSPHEAMKLRVFLEDAAVRLFGSADLGHVVADLSTGDGVDGETNEVRDVGPHGSPAGMPAVLESRDPSGLIARALRGEDEESDDSAADDFRAMRKAVKDTERVKRWERHRGVG